MSSSSKSATKVAVLATSEDQRHHLQNLLEQSGLDVVLTDEAKSETMDKINSSTPDVLLIDIGDDDDAGWDFVDTISEQSDIPMLFNDSGNEGVNLSTTGELWAKKLANKLVGLVHTEGNGSADKPVATNTPFPLSSNYKDSNNQAAGIASPPILRANAANNSSKNTAAINQTPAAATASEQNLNVWVLGASLGGPQAVRQFLSSISQELPVAFILAQHIGANHINLLAEQLNRVTAFTVIPGKNGHRLNHGEVILTPADKEISFTDDGYLALRPAPPSAIYSPSIDNVMIEVAKRFGKKAGTIVFSGMGDDGAVGSEAIANHEGIVWAQDIASCVVSSMPDHARKTGKVSYSANPEQLAGHLYQHYCG